MEPTKTKTVNLTIQKLAPTFLKMGIWYLLILPECNSISPNNSLIKKL
jgi:hypothetical protein